MEPRRLVLASGSRFRAAVLRDAGFEVSIDPPEVDERALDDRFDPADPIAHAHLLAGLKAEAVAARQHDALVIAADQLGVLDGAGGAVVLHKRTTVADAVEQLLAMAGRTHRLINALVVIDSASGERRHGTDVMEVTMTDFDRDLATAYVERFRPFDSAGSYRIEDEELMQPAERLIAATRGEHPSGIQGMPLPLLRRLLASF